jgi:hypothetical protein
MPFSEQLLRRTAQGAVEASVTLAPSATIQFQTSQLKSNPEDWKGFLNSLVWNAGTGAVVGAGLAAFHAIRPETHAEALTAAIDQVEAGKSVNVAPIVEKGAQLAEKDRQYDVDTGTAPDTPQKINELTAQESAHTEELNGHLEDAKSFYSTLSDQLKDFSVANARDAIANQLDRAAEAATKKLSGADFKAFSKRLSEVDETLGQQESDVLPQGVERLEPQKIDSLQKERSRLEQKQDRDWETP